jgi:hypothetical protein
MFVGDHAMPIQCIVGSEIEFNSTRGMLDDQIHSQCTTGLVAGISNSNVSCKRELTEEQIMAQRARNKATYASMTLEQRQHRRERQRLNNKAPLRKEAMKVVI